MPMFTRINNEVLLATYLLIQKDLEDSIDKGDEIFQDLLEKSIAVKEEILRRMKEGEGVINGKRELKISQQ